MQKNMRPGDRIFRIILGGVILGLYGALPAPWKYLTLFGLVPLASGITGFCPLYAVIGWNRQRPQAPGGR
jgi:hypothetical protein